MLISKFPLFTIFLHFSLAVIACLEGGIIKSQIYVWANENEIKELPVHRLFEHRDPQVSVPVCPFSVHIPRR